MADGKESLPCAVASEPRHSAFMVAEPVPAESSWAGSRDSFWKVELGEVQSTGSDDRAALQ